MFTIIGGDGKEYGPVSAEQVRNWLASGRANLSTRAKTAGSEEWQTLGDFAEFTGGGGPPALAAYVVPVVVTDAKAFADDLIARAKPLDVFACVERAFKLWTANFFPVVGVTLLVLLAMTVAGMIPLVGIVSRLLLTGVFYGGLFFYYLGKLRGEPRVVGDAFRGFSAAFVPLMLASLISSAITLAIAGICCAPMIGFFFKLAMQGGSHLQSFPTFSPLILVGFLIAFLVIVYLSVAWSFTFALIIDQGLGPWTALEVSRRVVTKQWFRVFFALLLGGILTLLGLIGFFIGILFTLPIGFATKMTAYESLCRPPPRV
ncbi:MAG: DUF4339 domain-containing protein [Opitutaceae bacterium]